MKIEIKYALIYVILSFLWNCLEYAVGYYVLHQYFVTGFFIVLTIVIFYLALDEKRAQTMGKFLFSKAFLTGLVLTLFIILINPVFMYIFYVYINPNFFNMFILYDVTSGIRTPEEASQYYTLSNFIARGTIYRLIMGLAATIIIYAFMKKDVRKGFEMIGKEPKDFRPLNSR